MKNKIVEFYLDEKINDLNLPAGVSLIEQGQFKLSLEVDTKKIEIPRLLDYFFKRYKIADLVIREIPIEEIIEDIYRK